tara:strand:- start:631 stop:1344 length:714 start_codon:yes stop_codon:yes gene_type:complete
MIYNWFKRFANLVIKKEDDMSLTNGAISYRNLSDVSEGNVVSFVYYGHGQNHGQLRHATVLEVFADGILAQEQNSSHPKHFKNKEAEDVKLEGQQDSVSGEVKGITFVDAKEILEEAGYANELVLDILTGEQLTVLFGSFHTSRENAGVGDFDYQWDSDNGNILVSDNRNTSNISVEAVGHDHTLRYVTFRATDTLGDSFSDFRVTVDPLGKITFQQNENVVTFEAFAKALNSLIKD